MSNGDAWLLCDGRPVASLEIADTFGRRFRGLLGRTELNGALMIVPAASVHTLGMRFDIDVAFCDRQLRVLHTVTMARHRFSRPRRHVHAVVEATAGAFERWNVYPGAVLEVQPQ